MVDKEIVIILSGASQEQLKWIFEQIKGIDDLKEISRLIQKKIK